MEKKRIGILGGSFDPVHCGHVALGRAAIAEGNLQKLIVMPAHVQPFKQGREVAEDKHRMEMCRLAFEDTEKAEVSDYEMTQTEISYTYDTLAWLESVYPDSSLYFITGTDAFLEIEYWRKGQELLEHYSFIVSVRPGYKEKDLEEKIQYYMEQYHTEVIQLHAEMPDVSSTKIKARRSRDLSIEEMVPECVERYIHEHKLYV
ncbi:MAG: nicotinate-nucleotide adenylyltransferase [Anaerovoracaceae bacterium]|nr:nicotinate-nucleotide adenylyltransferase [Anaerovoracaceae bacterium]